MSLLSRYLTVTVVVGSLITLLILLSLEVVFSFVDEAGDIGRGEYTAGSALMYVLLRAPYRAYEAFPMATLIGSLLGLGGLAARNELTVMRAVGISILGVARSVVMAGFVLALIAFALGEWVVPTTERWAQDLRSGAISQRVASDRLAGFWARDGANFVKVERALGNRHLVGMRIFEFDEERRLTGILEAERALYAGGGWVLEEITKSRFSAVGVAVDTVDRLAWDSDLAPAVLDVVVVDPEMMSARELRTYITYLERNDLDSEQYRLAFWIKVATPLATVAMLLLTVPMVFGSARSANAGQRLFVGVLIGIVFFLSNRLLNQMGLVYGLPPAFSALLPTLVFLAIGLWGIMRVR
ncbi:LPS export ABC transporter permease LptG [Alkalilimnicola ehrlichii]|uniref:LPS export ABC transporter permease LptG n=1 Tax=Alkalilimnicola ehrlichii TaxID=351052 RepID=A0A3E0X139_9GAMM|nr:LPS export ABC transporter permease LptG [Alkalilimnicola ehrlichii]RFA30453.1 LPS export ABC transporter permease LptG [Alkalilimnicola ehrlichii]RFA38006.1 LPS export ABC transporter permease LptG [Alkalilimnicola ehrlichii]